MSFLKTLVLVGIFCVSGVAVAQTGIPSVTTSTHLYAFQSKPNLSLNTTPSLSLNLPEPEPVLSLYNPVSNWYDTYLPVQEGYVKSSTLMTASPNPRFLNDVFQGADLNRQSLVGIQFTGPAVSTVIPVQDSFNPYGASTVGDALVSGFLGLLFN